MYIKEPIKDYPLYQIDTDGNIYNQNGSLKTLISNHNGYYQVSFIVDGKIYTERVNRLVAKQFILNDDPINKTQVNHKDGNKLNNNVSNLEWVTPSENCLHAVNVLKKSNARKIIGINKDTHEILYTFNSLADAGRYFAGEKDYRIYQNSIYRALSGLRQSYKGCIWKYID